MPKSTQLFIRNVFNGIKKKAISVSVSPSRKNGLTWLKEKYLKHAPPNKVRAYNYNGNRIYYAQPAEFLHSFKEIFVEEIYRLNLPPAPYILDCGANIGLSVIYLKTQFPDARIVAFEPDEQNFKLLRQNIKSFNFDSIEIKEEAVWNEDTYLTFHNAGNMGSRIETQSEPNLPKVKATRLKDYINTKVDFLKLDIESAEYEVLKDIKDHLHHVRNMFLEYHGNFENNNEFIEVLTIIKEAGFCFYLKEATNIYDRPFLEYNSVKSPYSIQLNIFCMRLEVAINE
jgi:FkbM family methyltransferase